MSLRRAAAKPLPAINRTWWPEAEIASNFSKDFPLGLVMQRINLYVFSIELRPNDLASPRTSRRTDEFIQNSNLNQLSRHARPLIHTYLTKRRVT